MVRIKADPSFYSVSIIIIWTAARDNRRLILIYNSFSKFINPYYFAILSTLGHKSIKAKKKKKRANFPKALNTFLEIATRSVAVASDVLY